MNLFNRILKLKEEYNNASKCEINMQEELKKKISMIQLIIRLWTEKWGIPQKSLTYLNIAIYEGAEAAAKWKGTTTNAVYKMISVRSKEFENKIGHSTINLIEQGKTDEALICIKTCWGLVTSKDVISPYLLSIISPNQSKDTHYYNLFECEKEIKYLYLHSQKIITTRLQELNADKIKAIFKIMESDTIYVKEKRMLFELFGGKITYSEFKQHLL